MSHLGQASGELLAEYHFESNSDNLHHVDPELKDGITPDVTVFETLSLSPCRFLESLKQVADNCSCSCYSLGKDYSL